MFKPTKKQGIMAGIVIALVAGLGVAASQVPPSVKEKVINALPGHAEEAPSAEPATPLPEEPATQSQTTVDNGSKKLTS